MDRQNVKLSMFAIPMVICYGLMMSAATALADSDDHYCSERTLSGDYGWASQGLVSLGQPPPQAPFSAVGVVHFDRKGSLSWVEHTIINGEVQGAEWTEATGTYSVNANCTGKLTAISPNSPVPLVLYLVIVRDGKEIRTVIDGHAITTVFVKVEDRR